MEADRAFNLVNVLSRRTSCTFDRVCRVIADALDEQVADTPETTAFLNAVDAMFLDKSTPQELVDELNKRKPLKVEKITVKPHRSAQQKVNDMAQVRQDRDDHAQSLVDKMED